MHGVLGKARKAIRGFLRAIQWLARKKVSVEVPINFPKEEQISLKSFELVYTEKLGWEDLFNGENLDGWEIKCHPEDKDKNFWKVHNGSIECNSMGQSIYSLNYNAEFSLST